MAEIEVSDSWNNRLKTVAENLAGCIPGVGKIVKLTITLFWPDEKASIWSLIKDQVEHLVEIKILEYELEQRTAQLNALHTSLTMYYSASNTERASLLSAILIECNDLYDRLTESDNAIHLIPVTVSFAFLHLSVLRERYEHGSKLYTDATNQTQWQKELNQKFTDYKSHFLSVYPEWQKWREDEITVSTSTSKKPTVIPPFFYWTAKGSTKDHFNGDSVKYSGDWNKNKKTFKDVQNRVKQRMYNEANAELMMDAYIQTFSLHKFLPKHQSDPPKAYATSVSKVNYGPYSVALIKGSHEKKDNDTISTKEASDKCGVITEIHVWAGSLIDRLQFHYDGKGAGHAFGATKVNDNNEKVIKLTDKHVVGAKMGFSNGVMARIKFKFSDGTSSDQYGNKSGRMRLNQEITADDDFRLVGATVRSGTGPGRTVGVAEVTFTFQHISVTPS